MPCWEGVCSMDHSYGSRERDLELEESCGGRGHICRELPFQGRTGFSAHGPPPPSLDVFSVPGNDTLVQSVSACLDSRGVTEFTLADSGYT